MADVNLSPSKATLGYEIQKDFFFFFLVERWYVFKSAAHSSKEPGKSCCTFLKGAREILLHIPQRSQGNPAAQMKYLFAFSGNDTLRRFFSLQIIYICLERCKVAFIDIYVY